MSYKEDNEAALELGLDKFEASDPCKKCGTRLRYARKKSSACVQCVADTNFDYKDKDKEELKMKKDRFFQIKSEEISGVRRNTVQFTCSEEGCENNSRIVIAKEGGALPSRFISRKMHSRGWFLGKSSEYDQCDECVKKHRELKRKLARDKRISLHPKEEENMNAHASASAETKPLPPAIIVSDALKADTPRAPTKLERRTIFLRIEDVYADEKSGYSKGWSDKRVADDLSTPLAWVRTIREENFGIERPAIDFKSLSLEVEKMFGEAHAIKADALAALNQARKIEDQVATIRRDAEVKMRDANALVERMIEFASRLQSLEAR